MRVHKNSIVRRYKLIGIFCLSVIALYGLCSISVRVFRIQEIEIRAEGIDLAVDTSKFNDNLLLLSTQALRAHLLEEYPLFADISIRKKFPHTLMITATRRNPFAVLFTASQRMTVDSSGIVLGNEEAMSSLPKLFFDIGIVYPGQKITDRDVLASLKLISASEGVLDHADFSVRDRLSIQAKLPNREILFPRDGDMNAKAATLQTILSGFRIKGTLPNIIDLRYDKPIVDE